MKEFQFYIDLIKEFIDMDNLKGTVYYNDGEWYSREHSRNITLEELREMVLAITHQNFRADELWERLGAFVSEKHGDETMDQFWEENEDL